MALFRYNTVDVARSSHTVQVPENSIAKLMYYLDVMCTLIEYSDHDLDELRDFTKFYNLTAAEK
ncbi:hypothetical protein I4U23_017920 [Adineta vaga]|nr:hypothetical protein I4U23_017920 [Adineta vaga]